MIFVFHQWDLCFEILRLCQHTSYFGRRCVFEVDVMRSVTMARWVSLGFLCRFSSTAPLGADVPQTFQFTGWISFMTFGVPFDFGKQAFFKELDQEARTCTRIWDWEGTWLLAPSQAYHRYLMRELLFSTAQQSAEELEHILEQVAWNSVTSNCQVWLNCQQGHTSLEWCPANFLQMHKHYVQGWWRAWQKDSRKV